MTISSSLNAGVAGLNAQATRLATISDNIANSATYGYKRVETDFHSMVIGGTGSIYTAGGVRTTNQRLIDQGGAPIGTSNATDLAVRGRGMLPVARAAEIAVGNGEPQMLLTTTGSFRPDADGFLKTESGLILLGWPTNPDGTVPPFPRNTTNGLEPVQVNIHQISGQPTTLINLGLNLPATATNANADGTGPQLPIEYFDNMGQSQTVQIDFTPTIPGAGDSNEWTMTLRDSAQAGAIIGEYTLSFDDSRNGGGTLLNVASAGAGGAFDAATGSLIVNVAGGPIEVNIGKPGTPNGLTQLGDKFVPLSVSKDGSGVASLTSVEVDENGFVHALFDTGLTRVIYQVPLVDMPNPNGMMSLDGQTYRPTPASGAFFLWDAGDGPTGDILSYALQESATDVAGELTDLIQTQRAYSSNAKIIQTVDEMLQETTNLKR